MIFLHLIILQKMEFTQGQYYLKVRQIVSTSLYVYSLSNRANLYQKNEIFWVFQNSRGGSSQPQKLVYIYRFIFGMPKCGKLRKYWQKQEVKEGGRGFPFPKCQLSE